MQVLVPHLLNKFEQRQQRFRDHVKKVLALVSQHLSDLKMLNYIVDAVIRHSKAGRKNVQVVSECLDMVPRLFSKDETVSDSAMRLSFRKLIMFVDEQYQFLFEKMNVRNSRRVLIERTTMNLLQRTLLLLDKQLPALVLPNLTHRTMVCSQDSLCQRCLPALLKLLLHVDNCNIWL